MKHLGSWSRPLCVRRTIHAILEGERDPLVLAKLRDRRCKHSESDLAVSLDGRDRPEHLTALRLHLQLWERTRQRLRQVADGEALQQLAGSVSELQADG